jgi:rhodanese-related sulfurtransferase
MVERARTAIVDRIGVEPSRREVLTSAILLTAATRPAAAQGSVWPDPTDQRVTLDDVDAAIDRIFGIPRMACAELQAAMANRAVSLIDVREPEEFAVSHLPGALVVDPALRADVFLAEAPSRLGGKPPVFYCSVGIRSARLLHSLDWDLTNLPGPAYYLSGGLFRWLAEGRTLIDADGQVTRRVHPKDERWARLLVRVLRAG